MKTISDNFLVSELAFARQKEWAPEWILGQKNDAWSTFHRLPSPNRMDEDWRFSSLRDFELESFQPSHGASALADRAILGPVPEGVLTITLVNDQLEAGTALPSGLPEGVFIDTLQQAWADKPDWLAEYLYRDQPDLGSEKLAALHKAMNRNGVIIRIANGVRLTQPVQINYVQTEADSAVFPYTLILAGEGSHCSVVEQFVSPEAAGRGLTCGMTNLVAGKNSEVHYLGIQRWNRDTLSFQLNTVEAAEGARIKNLVLQLGSKVARHENHSRIVGKSAHVDMFSVTVGDKDQELDQRTLQDHLAPGSVSDLLYKNVLADRARTIFSGLIKVEKDAQQTDAYQTNRNLLLSGEAEAVSMPGLEILANDVKCSHGATSGQISDDELFYMLTRGITPNKARELLVIGFLDDLISRIDEPSLQEMARTLVLQRLEETHS